MGLILGLESVLRLFSSQDLQKRVQMHKRLKLWILTLTRSTTIVRHCLPSSKILWNFVRTYVSFSISH